MEPVLLYLLGKGAAAHGYELMEAANGLGLSEVPADPGMVYRTLRALEARGCMTSAWETAGPGPARRNYVLTPVGWQRLAAWTDAIELQAKSMAGFAQSCRELMADQKEPGEQKPWAMGNRHGPAFGIGDSEFGVDAGGPELRIPPFDELRAG